jgi:pimeloyl-ACP methyl ester carboxylesterase
MFGPTLPALAQSRQVIAIELQGHGRTADIERPLIFEAMADDVAALVEQLGFVKADVMGCSLGGGVALQLAIRHPAVVRKLVVVSAPVKHEGWYPEVLAGFAQMGAATAELMKQSPPNQLFPHVDWAVLFTKLGALLRQGYDWSKDVAAITAPTLLVFADADSIRPAHIVDFYALLGGGQRDAGLDGSGRPANQLAILPIRPITTSSRPRRFRPP